VFGGGGGEAQKILEGSPLNAFVQLGTLVLPVNSIYVLPGGPFGNSVRGISEQFRL